jgi:hypothetical protein
LFYANDPEVLMYYKSIELPELKAELSLSYGGEEIEEILDFERIYKDVLTPEEAEDFKVDNMNGQLIIEKNFIGSTTELSKLDAKKVTRSYKNLDGTDTIHVGDVVVVELTFTRNSYHRCFDFQDPLPAGLTFLKTLDLGKYKYMYGNPMGNTVNLEGGISNLFNGKDETELDVTFKYQAIATKPGKYQAEPVSITDLCHGDHWIGESTWITIEE